MLKYTVSKKVSKKILVKPTYAEKNASVIEKGLLPPPPPPKKKKISSSACSSHSINCIATHIDDMLIYGLFGETDLQNICILLTKRRHLIWQRYTSHPQNRFTKSITGIPLRVAVI